MLVIPACYAENGFETGDDFGFVLSVCVVGCVFPFVAAAILFGGRQNFEFKYHACFDDMGVCCMGMFCPCVLWGQNASFGIGDQDPMMKNPVFGCMLVLRYAKLIIQ